MSNALWPTLPGLTWGITRTSAYNTKIQRSTNGAELRAAFYSAPLRQWSLSYSFLRSGQGKNELQTIQSFYNQRQGSFDSFLFDDPDDNYVTAHGFGVGDAVATAFQLQRAYLGTNTENVLAPVNATAITTPRTNVCLNSNNAAAWGTSILGTGVTPVRTADYTYAPDNTLSADRIVLDRGAGTTISDYSLVTSTTNPGGTVIGQTYAQSIWLKTNDGLTKILQISNAVAAIGLATVTPEWQRFTFTFVATSTNHRSQLQVRGTQGTDQYIDMAVWGSQTELGTVATDVIATVASSVTVSPAYYPASSDGFEPIYNINQTSTAIKIYKDGVLQTIGTHYSISSSGVVTFVTAPASNVALTWTGAYYWRVRFDADKMEYNNFMYQLYELKKVNLVTSR